MEELEEENEKMEMGQRREDAWDAFNPSPPHSTNE